jgi:spermidine synthase
VLGGGDGLALREVLKYRHVEAVTLVELDPAVVRLARTRPEIVQQNAHSFDDPRVTVVHADAFTWLRGNWALWDAVVVDMPDPDAPALAKLYSVEFYGLVSRTLAPDARMVVQAGSPYFAEGPFWCIDSTVQEAGLVTTPYHVDVPSFGDWGFVLATRDPGDGRRPEPRLSPTAPPLRFLTPDVLRAAATFPADRAAHRAEPSTLMHPVILDLSRKAWREY